MTTEWSNDDDLDLFTHDIPRQIEYDLPLALMPIYFRTGDDELAQQLRAWAESELRDK